MKLYHDPRSRSVRVQVMLEELGLDHELVLVSLERGQQRSEEHRRRHPLGQLPVLEKDEQTIFESVAICLDLADGTALAPEPATPLRATYYQWCLYAPGSLEPAMLRAYLESKGAPVPPGVPPLDAVLDTLETPLSRHDHLLPTGLSTADVVNGCTLIHGLQMGIEVSPPIRAYVRRLLARPAFAKAFPA